MRLAGRVAFVTGANTGIGVAIAERLAAEGAHVGIGAIEDLDRAEMLATRLTDGSTRCVPVRCDVTDDASVARAFDDVATKLGPASILVNNAALLTRAPLEDLDIGQWDAVLDVSLSGAFRCTKAALPMLQRVSAGAVVNLASELVWLGGTQLAHYVAAKGGVVGLTRALAVELGELGIRVNAVAPGPTETRMLSPAAREPAFIRTIPLRRLGRPEDVAAAVAFLCSDDAAWITGQVLGVNGGLVMAG